MYFVPCALYMVSQYVLCVFDISQIRANFYSHLLNRENFNLVLIDEKIAGINLGELRQLNGLYYSDFCARGVNDTLAA